MSTQSMQLSQKHDNNRLFDSQTNQIKNETKSPSGNLSERNGILFQHFVSSDFPLKDTLDSKQITPVCSANIALKELPFLNNQFPGNKKPNHSKPPHSIVGPVRNNYVWDGHDILSCASKSGKLVKQKDTQEDLRRSGKIQKPDLPMYNHLMKIHLQNKDLYGALNKLKEMRLNKVQPNIQTYNILFQLCGKTQKINEALYLFEGMKKQGIKPDNNIIYNTLIQLHINRREFVKSYHLLKEMWDAEIMPDISTYNIILECYANHGSEEELRTLLGQMHLPWNVATFNVLMQYCKKIEETAEGLRLFDVMLKSGIRPDVATYKVVKKLDPDMKDGDFQKKICQIPIGSDLESTKHLMKRYVRDYAMENALALLEELMQSSEPDLEFFRIVLKKCLRLNFLDVAMALWNKMLNLGIEPTLAIYNVILDLYARMEDRDAGEAIFKTLSEKFEPDVFTYSILLRLREGEDYRALFEEMKAKGIEPNVVIYTTLMRVFTEKENFVEVKVLWNEMLKKGIKPTTLSYNVMFDVCLKQNDLKNGKFLWNEMKISRVKPKAASYQIMIQLYENSGAQQGAEALKKEHTMKAAELK